MNMPSHPDRAIRLHPADNIVVALCDLTAGSHLELPRPIQIRQAVSLGHKVAALPIDQGQTIVKYGQPIGVARQPILPGEWVHSHNLEQEAPSGEYEFATRVPVPPVADRPESTFQGYERADGSAGTRNYLAIISNVNCSATVSRSIARHFTADRLRDFPQVDGVIALTHHSGCAMQSGGHQHRILNRVMAGVARHPNVGGYLLVGLGCEQVSLEYLIQDQQLVQIDPRSRATSPPTTLTIQNQGGTSRTVEAGIRAVAELLPRVNEVRRQSIPARKLILATQCGGSDGSSGITANPALGWASDQIVACGGTVILGETTEIAGAEQLLTQRAVSADVGKKLLERIAWWRWYAGVFGEQIDDNRSVGNAAGGLTTIAEKSLGAIAKGGSTALVDVYQYAEPVRHQGLVIMDSPGFDPCSLTGMVAAGANLIVFTTGRGSCYGCKPVPSIKVASNSPMFHRMRDDMDLNAGCILEGVPLETVGRQIFQEILDVASGKKTRSEHHGIGDDEFVPWMIGPVL